MDISKMLPGGLDVYYPDYASPGIANPPGCPSDFVAGAEYEPDAMVSASIAGYSGTAKKIYTCAADPINQFCGQSGFEPGTGEFWTMVWTEGTVCDGTVS